jgi:hypothetical protein
LINTCLIIWGTPYSCSTIRGDSWGTRNWRILKHIFNNFKWVTPYAAIWGASCNYTSHYQCSIPRCVLKSFNFSYAIKDFSQAIYFSGWKRLKIPRFTDKHHLKRHFKVNVQVFYIHISILTYVYLAMGVFQTVIFLYSK